MFNRYFLHLRKKIFKAAEKAVNYDDNLTIFFISLMQKVRKIISNEIKLLRQ